MKAHPVVFITVMDYDNLGVGYMASLLSERGFDTRIIDFNKRRPDLLRALRKLDPLLIGFSVIFHNYIDKFAELINYLRSEGISCHITAGGHYATLQYEELFRLIPGLDSIVRFEGEYPVAELAGCISRGEDWKKVSSIAYRVKDRIVTNPVLPLEKDLDKFPFPLRHSFRKYAFEKKITAILAGRGCIYNCTFCNTREFYQQASGPIKRIRKPEAVVSEMEYLYQKKGCSVFIFQDDDFPVRVSGKTEWIKNFCIELRRKELTGKIIWKINCRPDEIDEASLSMMKNHGLYLVFLGIEDGTDSGLKRVNKKMSVSDTFKGIEILKRLDIGFDFGFMLFQPATTFRSLFENIEFLKKICSDGYTPATFLKLVPFYDTQVAKELAAEGRLKISELVLDYDFIEDQMGECYNFIMECFSDWLGKPDGVENISKWARNYYSVWFHFYGIQSEIVASHNNLKRIISESNLFLLDTIKALALIYEARQYKMFRIPIHESYRQIIKANHFFYRTEIINIMGKILSFYEQRKLTR